MLWLPGMSGTGQVLEAAGSRLYGAAGSAYDAAVLATSGLVDYYIMNEAAGAGTAIDSGPGAKNGTNVGFTTGSASLTSDGETSYSGTNASRSVGTTWTYTTAFSFECIFRTPAVLGAGLNQYYVLMCNGDPEVTGLGHALCYRGTGNSPANEIQLFMGQHANVASGFSVAAATTYYTVVTVSGTTTKFYINGVLQNTKTQTVDAATGGTSELGNRPTNTFGFDGLFAKCAVYNVALGQSDITAHQNAR